MRAARVSRRPRAQGDEDDLYPQPRLDTPGDEAADRRRPTRGRVRLPAAVPDRGDRVRTGPGTGRRSVESGRAGRSRLLQGGAAALMVPQVLAVVQLPYEADERTTV